MNIFMIEPDVEHYKWLSLKEKKYFDILFEMRGQSVLLKWEVFEVDEIVEDLVDFDLSIGDYPKFAEPLVSENAMNVLKTLVSDYVEFLKVKVCNVGNYYVLNPVIVLDCLDLEKSKYELFDDGIHIMQINKYVFKNNNDFDKYLIFRIKNYEKNIYITESCKRIIEKNDLKGFRYIDTSNEIPDMFDFSNNFGN